MLEFRTIRERLYKKLFDSIKFLVVQDQILGLMAVTYSSSGFRSSKFLCSLNALIVCIQLSLAVFVIYRGYASEHFRVVKDTTHMIFMTFGQIFVASTWIGAILKSKMLAEFFDRIIDFDEKLHEYAITVNYKKLGRKFVFKALRKTVVVTLYVFCMMWVSASRPMVGRQPSLMGLSNLILLVFTFKVSHHVTMLVSLLHFRFVVLNKKIESWVNFPTKDKGKKILGLSEICFLHHHLSKLVMHFNDIFGVTSLLLFGVNFLIVVFTVFYASAELQAKQIDFTNVVITFVTCLLFTVETVQICDACFSTIEEANKSGELIHKIETEDRHVMDVIEMFSLQIVNEQVEFSAAGFFPINYTLVFSIASGVTTYIIILIQLSASLKE